MVGLRSNRSLSSTKHRPLRHWSAPSLIGAKSLSPHAAVSSGQGKKMPWWNQAGTQRNLVTVWPLSLQAQNDKETFDSQLWFSLVQCWFIGLGFSLIKNWKQINLLRTGCWIVAAIVIGFTHLLAAQTREKSCFFCGLWQWVWIAPHSLTHSPTLSLTHWFKFKQVIMNFWGLINWQLTQLSSDGLDSEARPAKQPPSLSIFKFWAQLFLHEGGPWWFNVWMRCLMKESWVCLCCWHLALLAEVTIVS